MVECNVRFCVRHKYEEDYKGVYHKHPCYELVYYASGTGAGHFRNVTYKFKKDDFVVLPPKVRHIERGDKDVEVIYIGFDILNTDIGEIAGFFSDRAYGIREYLEKIYYETQHWSKYSYQLINNFTEIIIIKLINTVLDDKRKSVNNDIKNIVDYISNNYMDDINAKQLAKIAGYSYDYFRKLFEQNMGVSVKDYLTQKRVAVAINMLKSKKYTVKEVAVNCGFKSSSHFCTVFKGETGETPYQTMEKESAENIVKDKFDKRKERNKTDL